MEKIYSIWELKENFKNNGINITLQGDAWSARHSGFWINEWGAMFDAGLRAPFNIEHFFISHTHSDHVFELYSLLCQNTYIPKVYVPYGTKQFVIDYILALRRLSSLSKTNTYLGCEIIEVKPKDVLNIKMRKKNFQVKIFKTNHTVNSVGFAFSEYRTKLKHEYKCLSKHKIMDLVKSKIQLSENVLVPLFIYTGDTRGNIFYSNSIKWNNYKIILTECTFIDDLSPDIDIPKMAEEKGHNYLSQLEKIALKFPETLFVLCHWSMRYKKEQIKNYFDSRNFTNIKAWVNM